MATKPREWTPQEAWGACAKAYREHWDLSHYWALLPFPPDPVERVSDDTLRSWVKGAHGGDLQLMALELIERRKADRDPSVVGQHGEKR